MATIAESLAVARNLIRPVICARPNKSIVRSSGRSRTVARRGTPLRRLLAQADICNDRGISFAQPGKLDEAIADFRQALQIHPDHLGALMISASSWPSAEDWKKR